jgi:hypothetical protein
MTCAIGPARVLHAGLPRRQERNEDSEREVGVDLFRSGTSGCWCWTVDTRAVPFGLANFVGRLPNNFCSCRNDLRAAPKVELYAG